jgi:hypothetical protein
MVTDQHEPTLRSGGGRRVPLRGLTSAAVMALVACLLAADSLTHDKPLALPALSVGLTVIGFTWATVVAVRHRRTAGALQDRIMGPGLVVFFGLAAAMLSDADQLVKYLHGQ